MKKGKSKMPGVIVKGGGGKKSANWGRIKVDYAPNERRNLDRGTSKPPR